MSSVFVRDFTLTASWSMPLLLPPQAFCYSKPFGCKCGGLALRYRKGKRRRNRGGNLVCYKCGRIVK